MITLETQLATLPRVTKSHVPKLTKLGLETVGDLLLHIPSRYDDFSKTLAIEQLTVGMSATIIGTVVEQSTIRTWKRRMTVTNAMINDGSGSIRAVWFNQPYIGNQLTEGATVRISGKVTSDKNGLYLASPALERASRTPTSTGRLVPIYRETRGITSKWLRWQIQILLSKDLPIPDPIPAKMLEELHLPDRATAIRYSHFPKTPDHALLAQKRFAFEEMLLMQLRVLRLKETLASKQAPQIGPAPKETEVFMQSLPFTLTEDQQKAVNEIATDLGKTTPMNRLLNGDVGSGKTVVAAIAALQATAASAQVAILAPTEVLARQHFEGLCTLYAQQDLTIALFTSAYKIIRHTKNPHLGTPATTRPKILQALKSGLIDITIGTHALLQDDVHFKNLTLIVVDEQHRFGVKQRAHLQEQSWSVDDGSRETVPHFLAMTATPIPRTLSLSTFGTLDVSLISHRPQNRKPIVTKVVHPDRHAQVYGFMNKELQAGRQAYIILPLVEESQALGEVKAAKEEFAKLQKALPQWRIGLLHGKMKAKEKEAAMQAFSQHETDILVATAVVEVGIDVPNATVMLIENAERFGLSQLHQFRGRVGRGKHQSYCFLSSTAEDNKRLQVLVQHTDGFAIAEEDLKLRGPGQFLGTQQSGFDAQMLENLTNLRLVRIAREKAEDILENDPSLAQHPQLAEALAHFESHAHFE